MADPERDDLLVDLADEARLAIGGPDAATLLQNLVTCDVREITPARFGPGALCTNKGRVAVLFDLLRLADGTFLLIAPRAMGERAAAEIRRMVFRARVTVEDASGRLGAVGLSGPNAPALLAGAGLPVPAEAYDAAAAGGLLVLRTRGVVPRFVLLGEEGPLAEARRACAAARPAGADTWRLADILAGVPRLAPALAEAFLPQFLDLDRRGGLSFSKGCYPGQEVVARTQHLGEVKRRLYRGRVRGPADAAPGTPLRALHADSARDGGVVLMAATDPAGDTRLLAVIPVAEQLAGHPLHLGTADGPRLELL